mgnify:CR=1 FL=1
MLSFYHNLPSLRVIVVILLLSSFSSSFLPPSLPFSPSLSATCSQVRELLLHDEVLDLEDKQVRHGREIVANALMRERERDRREQEARDAFVRGRIARRALEALRWLLTQRPLCPLGVACICVLFWISSSPRL